MSIAVRLAAVAGLTALLTAGATTYALAAPADGGNAIGWDVAPASAPGNAIGWDAVPASALGAALG
ncbi:hypothetical protein [Streptomyces sp. NPDC056670]|uniref:hypothetical protein n=1 Tax=Streptomyces sp. NPDC056670 TaxID=3345904 RepID=UPI0036B4984E